MNGQRHGSTMFFKTIVTMLVALCAQLILSAINLMLSLEITPNVEPGLSGFIAKYKNQNQKEMKKGGT